MGNHLTTAEKLLSFPKQEGLHVSLYRTFAAASIAQKASCLSCAALSGWFFSFALVLFEIGLVALSVICAMVGGVLLFVSHRALGSSGIGFSCIVLSFVILLLIGCAVAQSGFGQWR